MYTAQLGNWCQNELGKWMSYNAAKAAGFPLLYSFFLLKAVEGQNPTPSAPTIPVASCTLCGFWFGAVTCGHRLTKNKPD